MTLCRHTSALHRQHACTLNGAHAHRTMTPPDNGFPQFNEASLRKQVDPNNGYMLICMDECAAVRAALCHSRHSPDLNLQFLATFSENGDQSAVGAQVLSMMSGSQLFPRDWLHDMLWRSRICPLTARCSESGTTGTDIENMKLYVRGCTQTSNLSVVTFFSKAETALSRRKREGGARGPIPTATSSL